MTLTIGNAGHPPVVCIPEGEDPYLIKAEGDILGMFSDANFGQKKLSVSKGDRFFIYSDGLVESAENKITWATGADSLLPLYSGLKEVSRDKAPKALISQLFGDSPQPEDDIVLLCVEV